MMPADIIRCPSFNPLQEQYTRLEEKVDRQADTLNEIKSLLEARKVADDNQREDVRNLKSVVYGNGQPGLKGNVASLLETRSNVRWGFGLIWTLMVGVVAAVIKVAFGK
jgi:hypothetical protein